MEKKHKPSIRKTRDRRGIEGENALRFPFLLDQNLKQTYFGGIIQTEKIARSIIECVDRFAPETFIKSQNNRNDWETNKVKKAVTNRDELFHKWVLDPSDFIRETYKKQRNLVTLVIRKAERDANFIKLGTNPSTTTMK